MANNIIVNIDGKDFNLSAEIEPDYAHKLAQHVNRTIEKFKDKNVTSIVDDRLRTALIALNIADDYYKILDMYTAQDIILKQLKLDAKKLEEEKARSKTEIEKLKEENQTLLADLNQVNTEFNEFLHNFDSRNKDAIDTTDNSMQPLTLDIEWEAKG